MPFNKLNIEIGHFIALAFGFNDIFLLESAVVETLEEDEGDDGCGVEVAEFPEDKDISVISAGVEYAPLVEGVSICVSPASILVDSIFLSDDER